jgi:hypothetical protein
MALLTGFSAFIESLAIGLADGSFVAAELFALIRFERLQRLSSVLARCLTWAPVNSDTSASSRSVVSSMSSRWVYEVVTFEHGVLAFQS